MESASASMDVSSTAFTASNAVAAATDAAASAATAVENSLSGGGAKTLNWYFLIPLTILLFNIANMVFGGLVVQARNKYGIPYPTMYAVPGRTRYYNESMKPTDGSDKKFEERITNEEAFHFNSIQRGHQNTVENAPFFLALLVVAASTYPMIAGVCGLLYIIGRALYMYGYSQDPKLRMYGAVFIYPPLLTLFVLTGMRIVEIYQS
jgi:uncharacterized membrane protein YecN with MAPEG domain